MNLRRRAAVLALGTWVAAIVTSALAQEAAVAVAEPTVTAQATVAVAQPELVEGPASVAVGVPGQAAAEEVRTVAAERSIPVKVKPGSICATFGIPMAIVTGCCYAAAANLASFVSTEGVRTGRKRSRRQQVLIDMITLSGYILGGLIITAAYASGMPVPVVNATMVATNLMVNMFLQIWLRITFYDKSMRTGTVIFAFAVYQLAYLGPTPHEEESLAAMFSHKESIVWTVMLLAATVASAVGIHATMNAPMESSPKILAWSVLISVLGAVADNAAACLGLLEGWVLLCSMFFYGSGAFLLLVLSAKAPAVCDAAAYVPLQLCIQMVINMITGLVVWHDGTRMQSMQPYLTAFAICLSSVYMSSPNVDLIAGMHQWHVRRQPLTKSSFGRAVLELLASWQQDQVSPGTESKEDIASALQTMLTVGISRGVFSPAGVAELAVDLHNQQGPQSISRIVRWMQDTEFFQIYFVGHPEFAKALRSAVPPGTLEEILGDMCTGPTRSASTSPTEALMDEDDEDSDDSAE